MRKSEIALRRFKISNECWDENAFIKGYEMAQKEYEEIHPYERGILEVIYARHNKFTVEHRGKYPNTVTVHPIKKSEIETQANWIKGYFIPNAEDQRIFGMKLQYSDKIDKDQVVVERTFNTNIKDESRLIIPESCKHYTLCRRRITEEERMKYPHLNVQGSHIVTIEIMIKGVKWGCRPRQIDPCELKHCIKEMQLEVAIKNNTNNRI